MTNETVCEYCSNCGRQEACRVVESMGCTRWFCVVCGGIVDTEFDDLDDAECYPEMNGKELW